MFTGLIAALGEVTARTPAPAAGQRLHLRTALAAGLPTGASLACHGVCLSVVAAPADDVVAVDVSAETLERTTIGSWQTGRRIHLEPALPAGHPMGGHWVQGHVDGLARVDSLPADADPPGAGVWWFSVPLADGGLVAEKGSVSLDGVSLTVNGVCDDRPAGRCRFSVTLVPHTARVTCFSALAAGDGLHVEYDVLARYVRRYTEWVNGR